MMTKSDRWLAFGSWIGPYRERQLYSYAELRLDPPPGHKPPRNLY